MKCTLLVLAAIAAVPALANDVDPNGFDRQAFDTTLSRPEAQSELRHGAMTNYQARTLADEYRVGAKSRAEVEADLAAARARGEINYGEGYDPLDSRPQPLLLADPPKSRPRQPMGVD